MTVYLDVRLLADSLDAVGEATRFQQQWISCGAVVTFTGGVRGFDNGTRLDHLYLDWYPGMSDASIAAIANDASDRFDLTAICVLHRCGQVRAGEPIVFVSTASAHRRPAFEAADYLMDRLKSQAALWKREVGPGIDRWIEPTVADGNALERWNTART